MRCSASRDFGSVEFVLPVSEAKHEKMKFPKQDNRFWQKLHMKVYGNNGRLKVLSRR